MNTIKTLLTLRRECTVIWTGPRLDWEKLGLCMRSLREDAGISLDDMAGRIGVERELLIHFENGCHQLTLPQQVEFVWQTQAGNPDKS